MRNVEFKIRLSESEHERLKEAASEVGLQLADYVRFCTFGPSGSKKVPNQAQLKEILYVLSRTSDNINRAMEAIHRAEKSGKLNQQQFKAMHEAIKLGIERWEEPRQQWLKILKGMRG